MQELTDRNPNEVLDPYLRRVKVVRCVDGDTVDVIKDLGERVFKEDRYRLLGINTPERGQAGFDEATDYLEMLCKEGADDEGWLYMRTEKFGKYRWLGVLYNQKGENINLTMIESGHAEVY